MWSCLPVLLVAATAAAQPPVRPGAQGHAARAPLTEKDRMRLQIAAMEGLLANAVAEIHNRALEAIMPSGMGMFTFEGGSRARGFRLDGYGVFFDVDLPPLPRSMFWSVRMLDMPVQLDDEIAALRRAASGVSDPAVRRQIEQTIQRIQGKVEPMTVNARPDGTGVVMAQRQNRPPAGVATQAEDPFQNYVADLGNHLTDMLVDYGGTIDLGSDDWLTIAARETQPRLLPGGPLETAVTLRIKGADLAALKAGRLSREEARKKVEIKEF
jgi:hypothetical protein